MAKRPIRPITVKGNIAFVPLSRGAVAIIDAESVPLVASYNWRIQSAGPNHVYAGRSVKHAGRQTIHLMHRVIADADAGEVVDHINGDRLDNRKENLRVCSQSENLCNRGKQSNNRSGFKGVYLHAPGRWRARIMFKGKLKELGLFDSPSDAHKAYVAAARALHGEFTRVS